MLKSRGFSTLSIARPGLLNRGNAARTMEKIALWIMPSIDTSVVAAALVEDAEQMLVPGATARTEPLANSDLRALAAAHAEKMAAAPASASAPQAEGAAVAAEGEL